MNAALAQAFRSGAIVAQFLRRRPSRRRHFSEVHRRAVRKHLAVLERESERMLPNADALVHGARMLAATRSPA
jgi:hypothetical protein